MRISLELEAVQIGELDRLAESRGTKRAALIREGIAQYLASHASSDPFGSWRDGKVNGVDYQRKIRDEW